MIWTVREQIAYLSTIVTLEPGDVIATGTPAGVGMAKGTFLKDGDVMEASIEEIGTLRNPVSYER
jgi:2-keto-4-pentenoate hydratase/2-oxohepta-3-ene-1,7-dioic acid hydratase in catechol pathway